MPDDCFITVKGYDYPHIGTTLFSSMKLIGYALRPTWQYLRRRQYAVASVHNAEDASEDNNHRSKDIEKSKTAALVVAHSPMLVLKYQYPASTRTHRTTSMLTSAA